MRVPEPACRLIKVMSITGKDLWFPLSLSGLFFWMIRPCSPSEQGETGWLRYPEVSFDIGNIIFTLSGCQAGESGKMARCLLDRHKGRPGSPRSPMIYVLFLSCALPDLISKNIYGDVMASYNAIVLSIFHRSPEVLHRSIHPVSHLQKEAQCAYPSALVRVVIDPARPWEWSCY